MNKKSTKNQNQDTNQQQQGSHQQQQVNPQPMDMAPEPTMRELMQNITEGRKEVYHMRSEIHELKTMLIPRIVKLEERVTNQDGIIQALAKKVTDLSSRQTRTEKEQKKNNIIIKGVQEEPQEPAETLKNKVMSILQNELHSNIIPISMFRIGAPTLPIRPIRIILNKEQDKYTIFSLTKNSKLRDRNIFITEDLPQETSHNRKILRDTKRDAEGKGHSCEMKKDRLRIDNLWYNIQDGAPKPMKHQPTHNTSLITSSPAT